MKLQRYITVITTLLLLSTFYCSAQEVSKIKVERGEKWWGGFTALGAQMPYITPVEEIDFSHTNLGNQSVVFFVSSLGRYIYHNEPVVWSFDGNGFIFNCNTEVKVRKVGRNLRSAYVVAINEEMNHHSLQDLPSDILFSTPQYNTAGELQDNQNQLQIIEYATEIIKNDFPPGVIIINDGWQDYYGSMDFSANKFWDIKQMVDSLHSLGFSVMLSISPYVSPDSKVFRELDRLGYLVVGDSGEPHIARWSNGYSAVVDMANLEAMAWFEAQLLEMQSNSGIDGFKFEGGDLSSYTSEVSTTQLAGWQTLASGFNMSELRSSWGGGIGNGGRGVMQKLKMKDYNWKELKTIIPEVIAAGLLGYPFICVEELSGGLSDAIKNEVNYSVDQELFVRSVQLMALMPAMQFSNAPWKILDTEHLTYVRNAAKLHTQFSEYILALVKEVAISGEPIIRNMEYNYPRQGFTDCKDQFMLGTKYIVTPILDKEHKRLVRLPRGTWQDDQGTVFRGPLVMEIEADIDRLPYFIRK